MKKILIIFTLTIITNMWVLIFFDTKSTDKNSRDCENVLSNNLSILKVNNNDVFSLLTDEELNIINESLSDLCVADTYNINMGLNSGLNNKIINSFNLMKRRLSKEEYSRICEIFHGIFNIEQIENEILNKS